MTTSTTLIDFLLSLLRDPEALAAYQEDPEGYLTSCGIEGISPAEVHDALVLLEDNQDADFSRDYNTGGNAATQVPTPPPAPAPASGQSDHDAAIQYLNTYITNNFIDDRDTITDNSINQQIDTGGGDFDQEIDIDSTVASGDGSVAAGGDIEDSTVVTGSGNQVGDGNVSGTGNVVGDNNQAVTGSGNTTAFGDGDATSTDIDGDVTVGDGSALNTGPGTTTVDNSVNDSGNTSTETTIEDSFNEENSVEISDSNNDNSDNSINDSGNDSSQTTVVDA